MFQNWNKDEETISVFTVKYSVLILEDAGMEEVGHLYYDWEGCIPFF